MNSLLRAFDEGKILKKGTQSVLWNIMAGCSTGPERLKGQLPRDYVVAHKTDSGTTCDRVIASMARWLCLEWQGAGGR